MIDPEEEDETEEVELEQDDLPPSSLARSKAEIKKRPGRRMFHSIVANIGDYACDIVFMQYGSSDEMRKANKLPNGHATCMLVVIELPTRYAYALL
jgi:hypothetical protein